MNYVLCGSCLYPMSWIIHPVSSRVTEAICANQMPALSCLSLITALSPLPCPLKMHRDYGANGLSKGLETCVIVRETQTNIIRVGHVEDLALECKHRHGQPKIALITETLYQSLILMWSLIMDKLHYLIWVKLQ